MAWIYGFNIEGAQLLPVFQQSGICFSIIQAGRLHISHKGAAIIYKQADAVLTVVGSVQQLALNPDGFKQTSAFNIIGYNQVAACYVLEVILRVLFKMLI